MAIGWSSLESRKQWAQVTPICRPYIRASWLAECGPRTPDPEPVGEMFSVIYCVRVSLCKNQLPRSLFTWMFYTASEGAKQKVLPQFHLQNTS